MNAISTITQLPTLSEIGKFKQLLKSELLDSGNYNLLDIWHYFKASNRLFKELLDDEDILKATILEAEKQGSKSFKKNDVNFTIKEAGTKYDYSECNDIVLNEINKQLALIEKAKKEREEFLKTIKSEVYDNNGNQLFAPVKTSKTTLEVRL